jgi:hypothetical protein
MARMKKYLSIKAPPGKGNITLEEAIDAARRVLANGSRPTGRKGKCQKIE